MTNGLWSCGYQVDAPGRNPHEEYAFILAEWAEWREYRGFMRPLKALRPTAHFDEAKLPGSELYNGVCRNEVPWRMSQ